MTLAAHVIVGDQVHTYQGPDGSWPALFTWLEKTLPQTKLDAEVA